MASSELVRPVGMKRLDHVSLRVRHLEDSADFYCNTFSLRRRPTDPPSDRRCRCESMGEDGSVAIELTEGRPLAAGSSMDHMSFEVTSLEDVVTLRNRAIEAGARTTPIRRDGGRWQASAFDPDGNKIQIFARTEEPQDVSTAARIRREIMRDDRLSEQPLDVEVHDGVVHLRGSVQSNRRKLAALEIASECPGCHEVIDEIGVDPPSAVSDAALADAVRNALAGHDRVAKETIAVSTRAGEVTLRGTVGTDANRCLAEDIVMGVEGVRGVENLLVADLTAQSEDRDVEHRIEQDLSRELGPVAEAVQVAVAGGTVVLSGRLPNGWYREKAIQIVHRSRVNHVRLDLTVGAGKARP